MSIRTSWRARTGMPTRLHEAHGTSTIDQNTTPHGRHRTAGRAGGLAIAAALTMTLAPTAGAQAATPAAATVTATSAASTATKTTAKVHLKASKMTWVKGKKAAKVTAKVRTGAAPTGGTVTFYDGGKRLKKKTVGASGTVSYRLPRKLSAKKHTIRAVFRPSAQTAAVVAPGRDSLKVRVISEGAQIAKIAKQYVGVRYRSGGGSPSGFDCSGFTSYVYKKAGIAKLPRSSAAQRHSGKIVSRSKARTGDLIWTRGHVAIYLGNGKQIDAPRPGKAIQVRSIWQSNPTFIRV